jgi:hypothetical protein
MDPLNSLIYEMSSKLKNLLSSPTLDSNVVEILKKKLSELDINITS